MHRLARTAVAAAAVVMTACTSPSSPSSTRDDAGSATPDTAGPAAVGGLPRTVHRFGARVRVAVDGAAASVTVGRPHAAQSSRLGEPSGTSYAVRVRVVGRSGTFDVNPRDFVARDRSGDTFRVDLGGVDDQLGSSSVPPGATLRGRVAFDVPKGKRIVAVHLLTVLGDPVATWRTTSE